MGRMMCVSAILESGWVTQGSAQGSQKQLMSLIDILVEVYHRQEFLREAIQVIVVKVLRTLVKGVKVFDYVVEKLLLANKPTEGKQAQLQDTIFQTSSSLSLFLCLRDAYLECFDGQSQEHDEIMQYQVVQNKKHLHQISALIKAQTYLYPRLHSSLPLLIKELFREKKALVEKNLNLFIQIILEDAIFNEEVHDNMKSVAKFKYLHIGLKVVEAILNRVQGLTGSKHTAMKLRITQTLLLEGLNIRSMVIRNVQMPKN